MRLRTLVVVVMGIGLALAPSAAAGGGWWSSIDLPGAYVGAGETFTVRSHVLFADLEEYEEARESGEYFAYLIHDLDPSVFTNVQSQQEFADSWRPPAEMTLIGDVELTGWDANIVTAVSTVTIPDLPPGSYDVMFCDAGCTRPLGDLIPTGVRLAADPITAQTARRLDGTRQRLHLALARVRRDVRHAERRIDDARADAATAARYAENLGRKLAAVEREPSSPAWIPYLGWFLSGAVLALLLRRRAGSLRATQERSIETIPDDARELVELETERARS